MATKFGKVTVTGFKEVEKNLNTALSNMKINSTNGLGVVAKAIHRDANTIPPLIPRETGNLINSRFIVNDKGQVIWGNKARFKQRVTKTGKPALGKWSGSNMLAHHKAMIAKYKAKAMKKIYPTVILGYTAPYAVYPHEMGVAVNAGKAINWTRPGSGAKFFQAAMMNKTKTMMGTLYQHTNIKGKRKPIKGIKYGATIGGGTI